MPAAKPIILVNARHDECQLVSRALRAENLEVVETESRKDAILQFNQPIDVVVCDLSLRGQSCHELIRLWHERRPTTPFILLADADEVADAIEAMKHGAADYVAKPINGDELVVRVTKWLEASRKDERLKQLESRFDRCHSDDVKNDNNFDIPTGTSLEALERAAVERALAQHRGNRTHAAKSLGISVRTLQRKLKAWRAPVFAFQHRPSRQEFSAMMMR